MFLPARPRMLHKCLKILRLTFVKFNSTYNEDLKDYNLIRTVEKTIDDNTSIIIESPIHVRVLPIDVHDLKAHNKLIMTLYSHGKDTGDFQVKQTSKKLELINKTTTSDRDDVCVVQMPYHLKMHVSTTDDASVKMSKLEGTEIVVKSDKGDIEVSDIKAQTLKIESAQGTLLSKGRLLAECIDLKTGFQSTIACDNIMATNFTATTHAGPIFVKSCYSGKSHFTTLSGNITLSHLHKQVLIDVIQHGNLYIKSFSGNLQASLKSGDVYMVASNLTEKSSIFVHEKGKVELFIPNILANLPATNLIADKIFVDDKILKLGRFMDDSHPQRFRFEKEPQNELHIVCKNGSIALKESDVPFII